MKIAVCIKPISLNKNKQNIKSINELDKYALEEAVRIKEKYNVTVTTFSMGIDSSIKVLEKSIQLGSDRGILLTDPIFAGSDTNATSYILSKSIKQADNFDLIICGAYSQDSATGQVGVGIASKLSIPYVINVIKIDSISDGKIICESLTDTGTIKVEMKLPALICVNKNINIPRIATIFDILNIKNKIEIWNNEQVGCDVSKCGLKGSPTRVISTTNINRYNTNCKYISGNKKDISNKIINIIKDNIVNKNTVNIEKFNIKEKNSNSELFVYCEFYKDNIKDISLQILGKARELSDIIDTKVSAILFSKNQKLLDILTEYGADNIYSFDEETNYYNQSLNIINSINKYNPQIFLFGKTFYGKSISSFIASNLETGLTADCIDLSITKDNRLLQRRLAYNGDVIADIICQNKNPQMATIAKNVFKPKINKENKANITYITNQTYDSKLKITNIYDLVDVNSINENVILVGGAGLKTKNNFNKLIELSKIFKCNIGATRAAVDLGLIDSKYQIGETGNNTSADLYIGFGVSGANEHVIGLHCKNIIAINNDSNAPIFEISNYGVIEDANLIISDIIKEMEDNGNGYL